MKFSRGSSRIVAGHLLLMGAAACLVVGLADTCPLTTAHASARGDRKLGAAVFHDKGCEHCHGADGVGTERGPQLSGVGRSLHKPEIENQIRAGGKEMPAFGDALTNDEVEQLVAYLASKKKKGVKPGPWASPATTKN